VTEEYAAYLQSGAWQVKRLQRLQLSGFRCSACRSTKELQVHHLTYERIFEEEMADLLPLCDRHHDAAEKLISDGKLQRIGDVQFLAVETVRLVCPSRKRKRGLSPSKRKWQAETRKPKRERRGKRGFGSPRLRWTPVTEAQRHEAAINRANGF
jgi:hypothetical protein